MSIASFSNSTEVLDDSDATTLRPAGIIDMPAVAGFVLAARHAVARNLAIRVECADTTYFSLGALQTLVALREAGTRAGWAVTVEALRPDVMESIRLVGLDRMLGLDSRISSS